MAKSTGNNSFIFWGATNLISDTDIDPNYLLPKMFADNPFHQSLHKWANINPERPLFHVDIHGKCDRENNCEVDVGICSMDVLWENDPLGHKIRVFFEQHGNIFGELKFNKGFKCKFNTNPNLHGYWGGEIHTMTTQAILLGIPSIQFEIPFSVRKRLLRDKELRAKLNNLVLQLYHQVIVPDYN
jgi:hypothetical protein